ncbi:MAG TPA: hypothetical protein VHF27_00420 [Acidimicrobiales bacterium]|nr:hypothetical protein [Acidimicrobiales bacterium]
MEKGRGPVAKARIELSYEERERIARELEVDDVDSIPEYLDLAKFPVRDMPEQLEFQLARGRGPQVRFPAAKVVGALLIPQ